MDAISRAPEPANLQVALSLASRGIAVFPVHAGGPKIKQPMPFFRWKDQSGTDERTIREWWRRWPDAAPAIDLGKSRLFVVDADRHDVEHDGVAAWAALMAEEGASPDGIPIVSTPNDGNHWIFRQDGTLGNGRGRLPSGIDVRGSGGYIVAPGAVMSDGRCYEVFGDPGDAPPVPSWLTKWLVKEGRAESDIGKAISAPAPLHPTDTGSDEIAALLDHIPADADYETWVSALMAVHAATGGSSSGLSLADQWSSRGSKYKKGEVARKWGSFKSSGINGATLAALARQYGADLSAIRIAHMERDEGAGTAEHGRQVLAVMQVRGQHKTSGGAQVEERADGSLVDTQTGELLYEAASVAPEGKEAIRSGLDWTGTSGLIGEIADWIVATARRPNRPLAVGAAISIVGTMCGRHISTPTGCGTHLYIGCVGASTIGKDRPLKAISRVFTSIGLPTLAQTGKFKSDSAIENILARAPCCCAIVDEMGTNLFAKSSHARASTHEQGITGVLRELWSTSFDDWHGSARAMEDAKTIKSPAFSIFGASTIDEFYASLGKGVVQNGFLNRFTIIKAGARADAQDVDVDAMRKVPQSIVDGLLDLLPRAATPGGRGGVDLSAGSHVFAPYTEPPVRTVPFASDEVKTAYASFEADILARMDRNPDLAPFLGRIVEMTIRLATIHAVSKLGLRAEVRLEDLEWAKAVSLDSAETMIGDVSDRIIENDYHGKYKRVEGIIRERKTLKRSDLTKRLNGSIHTRDVTDILRNMEEGRMIDIEEIKTSGRTAWIIKLLE